MVESVKVASGVHWRVAGDVVEVNGELEENPAIVNEDAVGKGLFFKVKIADPNELTGLLDEAAYKELIATLARRRATPEARCVCPGFSILPFLITPF